MVAVIYAAVRAAAFSRAAAQIKMGENLNYDFRTPLQKQQDERKKNIIAMFADFRAKAPAETSDSRIMLAVSQRVGCTQQNVRVILIKAGLITPKKRRAAVRK